MALRSSCVTKAFIIAGVSLLLLALAILGIAFGDFHKDAPYLQGPKLFGLPFEDVHLKTKDNVHLHGWFIKQKEAKKAPTFICFQGNDGYQGLRLGHASMLYRLGFNILLVDYRGFGRSEGSPTEQGVYRDADAALDFVLNNKTINNKEVFVLGHSLGGAVAIDLASRRGNEIKGLVVENAFTSLKDIIRDAFPQLRPLTWMLQFIQRTRMSNIEKVGNLKMPTLFLCGRQDTNIPAEHTDRLYKACGAPKKWLESVPAGSHFNSHYVGWGSYSQRLLELVRSEEAARGETLTENSSQASPEKHLDAESSELVGTTVKDSDDEEDTKTFDPLRMQAKKASLVLLVCTIALLALSISHHRKSRHSTKGAFWRPLADTDGEQLGYSYTEGDSTPSVRNWQLADDESMQDWGLKSTRVKDTVETIDPAVAVEQAYT